MSSFGLSLISGHLSLAQGRAAVAHDEDGAGQQIHRPVFGSVLPYTADDRRARAPQTKAGWTPITSGARRRNLHCDHGRRDRLRRCHRAQLGGELH